MILLGAVVPLLICNMVLMFHRVTISVDNTSVNTTLILIVLNSVFDNVWHSSMTHSSPLYETLSLCNFAPNFYISAPLFKHFIIFVRLETLYVHHI